MFNLNSNPNYNYPKEILTWINLVNRDSMGVAGPNIWGVGTICLGLSPNLIQATNKWRECLAELQQAKEERKKRFSVYKLQKPLKKYELNIDFDATTKTGTILLLFFSVSSSSLFFYEIDCVTMPSRMRAFWCFVMLLFVLSSVLMKKNNRVYEWENLGNFFFVTEWSKWLKKKEFFCEMSE